MPAALLRWAPPRLPPRTRSRGCRDGFLIPFSSLGRRASDGRSRGGRGRTVRMWRPSSRAFAGQTSRWFSCPVFSGGDRPSTVVQVSGLSGRGRPAPADGRSRYPRDGPPGAAGEGPAQGAVACVEVEPVDAARPDQPACCSAWPGAARTSARPGLRSARREAFFQPANQRCARLRVGAQVEAVEFWRCRRREVLSAAGNTPPWWHRRRSDPVAHVRGR